VTKRLTDDEKRERHANRVATQQSGQNKETSVETEETQGFNIKVEQAPEGSIPEPEESKVSTLDSVLMKLGIKNDPKSPEVKIQPGGKLNKGQEEFVETVTPFGATVLTLCLGWAWSTLDADYRILAPSNDAATQMVAPLIRIYARHNKALVKASPDTVDWLAFINAFVMYMYSALTLLSEINRQKREFEENDNRPRDIRTSQATTRGASNGSDDLSGTNDASTRQSSSSSPTPKYLDERDRQQFESLNLLRERDIAARARRSGRL
jgi:hypothetical protein